MIRIAATLCFCLTLLCPVFCLASEDGNCPDHGQSPGRNCEAMSVGAVVVDIEDAATTGLDATPSIGRIIAAGLCPASSSVRTLITVWNRSRAHPPPAAIRQSLLQTFLF